MVGVLTKLELLRALTERGPEAPITDVMSTDFEVIDANEMLESGFRRMQERQCHTAPVMHHGQLVGLLTMDNVGEFMLIESAMRSHRIGGPGGRKQPATSAA